MPFLSFRNELFVTFVGPVEDVINSLAIGVLYEQVFLDVAVRWTITCITFPNCLAPFLENQ